VALIRENIDGLHRDDGCDVNWLPDDLPDLPRSRRRETEHLAKAQSAARRPPDPNVKELHAHRVKRSRTRAS
jgi:hypothetical protein